MRKAILSLGISSISIVTGLLLFQNCGAMENEQLQLTPLNSEFSSKSTSSRSDSAISATAISLFRRIAGVTPSIDEPLLNQMEDLLIQGDPKAAALLATQTPEFINITVRDFATKMSNLQQSVDTPLNDLVATVMGVVRDDIPATDMLTKNFYYRAVGVEGIPENLKDDIIMSNNHYLKLDETNADLNDVLTQQEGIKVISPSGDVEPLADTAGVLTSRGWMAAHAEAGTNRRLITHAFSIFLCSPIKTWASSANPEDFVGRDVGRLPTNEFRNKCKACHSAMDALRPASAYFDFSEGFTKHRYSYPFDPDPNDLSQINIPVPEDEQLVPAKFRRGSGAYPMGRIVKDSNWINYTGDELFGWRSSATGAGMNSFGEMIGQSEQFSRCMAERVFKIVCRRDHLESEKNMIQELATDFENENYQFRSLFINTAIQPECIGLEL